MKGPGGPGEGEIDPPTAGTDEARPALRADEAREEREEEGADLEGRVRDLEARLAELEGELESSREALTSSERRREIERAALEADALDAETVALLTEVAVSAMSEPDVRAAVEELRREKPFLFRGGARRKQKFGASAMSASVDRSGGIGPPLDELADEARASGDRGALLAYLRRRRGV